LDSSSFAKYEVTGAAASQALDRLLAGKLPTVGRIRLTLMLAPSGRLMGDLTTLRLADDRFLIFGSGYLQSWHLRWFDEHLVGPGVEVRNVTDELGGLALVGPRSRELLARLAETDVSNDALPFMSGTEMPLKVGLSIVARLSVTGELGYEIYVPAKQLPALLNAVLEVAPEFGARHIGMYALNSLRLEKGFGIWSREFSRDYTPKMSGLDRFVAYDKGDFVGREAALRERSLPPAQRLVTLAVEAADADAAGYEPIWSGGDFAGFVTSGGFGHCAGVSLAMGYLRAEVADDETDLSVTILGERRACRILKHPAIDPTGMRMRA
jgi:dimethylglycine dehydrogenase